MIPFRTGFGFDVHKFAQDRELWLGGIKIPHTLGLLGHSDADVALHALCDALLGAAALRDIGYHFPDNDNNYKGIDSKILLRKVILLLKQHNFYIGNIDITIVAQQPKLAPYIPQMQSCIAENANISPSQVGIKATTTEQLGFTGRKEGIAAYANVLIYKNENPART